jgi:uncharacterized protein YacL
MSNEMIFLIVLSVAILCETSFLAYGEWRRGRARRIADKIYVDTSTLIDGRILGVAKAGFITDDLLIPRSVLRELQLLADGKDSEKRARARFGLDVASELERTVAVNAYVYGDKLDRSQVDERLIELARRDGAAIMTNDYNLNKVATAEGLRVLNINDLAMAMRDENLPGEKSVVKITTRGSGRGQGVGYLSDGTMVVVDKAANKVGKTVEVEFVKRMQTAAGKMVFAKVAAVKKH